MGKKIFFDQDESVYPDVHSCGTTALRWRQSGDESLLVFPPIGEIAIPRGGRDWQGDGFKKIV